MYNILIKFEQIIGEIAKSAGVNAV